MRTDSEKLSFAERLELLLKRGDIDEARAEAERLVGKASLTAVRKLVVAVINGTDSTAEVIVGVAARAKLAPTHRWFLVLAALTRDGPAANSALRVSLFALAARALSEAPAHPKLAALSIPGLVRFAVESLSTDAGDLIAEQALEFISSYGRVLASYRCPNALLHTLGKVARRRARQVDDPELRSDWQKGVSAFARAALVQQARDGTLASEISWAAEQLFRPSRTKAPSEAARARFEDYLLGSLTLIMSDEHAGMTLSLRMAAESRPLHWASVATHVDRLERFMQELADEVWRTTAKPLEFTPQYAAPGSWTIFLATRASKDCSAAVVTALRDPSVRTRWSEAVAGLDGLQIQTVVVDNRALESAALRDHRTANDAQEKKLRLLSRDVPQADNLERVMSLLRIVRMHSGNVVAVRQRFLDESEITPRQYSYYLRAALILGLVDDRVRITGIGRVVEGAPRSAARPILESQFLASNVGSAWALWSRVSTVDTIKPDSAEPFLAECAVSLSPATRSRRADTLRAWVQAFHSIGRAI
jgi:hypothetical protein